MTGSKGPFVVFPLLAVASSLELCRFAAEDRMADSEEDGAQGARVEKMRWWRWTRLLNALYMFAGWRVMCRFDVGRDGMKSGYLLRTTKLQYSDPVVLVCWWC